MPTVISTPSTITQLAVLNQLAAMAPFAAYNGGVTHQNANTTINSKRNVFPTELAGNNLPKFLSFGIGINGVDGSGQNPATYKPRIREGDLYAPIPIFMALIENDMNVEARAGYRMRQVVSIGGTEYVLYWHKLLDFAAMQTDSVRFVKLQLGSPPVVISDPYADIDMSPTPSTDLINDSQIVAQLACKCAITHAELELVLNTYIPETYPGINAARISEFGIFTGVDTVKVLTDGPYAGQEYNESIYTQMQFHRCTIGQDLTQMGSSYEETVVLENANLALLN